MPEVVARDDAAVRIDATGVCGAGLHIDPGRLRIEPGFTVGHEAVGTVITAGGAVTHA
jgi:D-arabinose 1-dehydrogenase-like Zn-dependent alcohol dehydrogenase